MGIKKPNSLIVAIVGTSGIGRSLTCLPPDEIQRVVESEQKDPFAPQPYVIEPLPMMEIPVFLPSNSMCPKEYGQMKQRKKFRR